MRFQLNMMTEFSDYANTFPTYSWLDRSFCYNTDSDKTREISQVFDQSSRLFRLSKNYLIILYSKPTYSTFIFISHYTIYEYAEMVDCIDSEGCA